MTLLLPMHVLPLLLLAAAGCCVACHYHAALLLTRTPNQAVADSFDAEFDTTTGDDYEGEEDGVGREWASQSKHFFILSDAGKPIYSR
jgi:hypothetical protein